MKKLLFMLLFALSINAWSQQVFSQTDKPYIEVKGSAEMEVVPNIIILSVRLKEYEENKAKVTMEQIEKKFFVAVEQAGIDKQNVSLSNLKGGSLTQKRKDREFLATKSFVIVFSKVDQLDLFLTNVENAKPDEAHIDRLSHTDIEKFRLEVKVEALKAAKSKAEALLNSVNSKLGKPLLIQENDVPTFDFLSNRVMEYQPQDTGGNAPGSDIQFKKIKIRFEILARFAID